jgi:hypothetical protein
MRLRETIHDKSLLSYSSSVKLGRNSLKRQVVLLATLSPLLPSYSSMHAQVAQQPTPGAAVEQCDENQAKGTPTIPPARSSAASGATTATAKAPRSVESTSVMKDRLRLPGVTSGNGLGEAEPTQCTTDEERGPQPTPAASEATSNESGKPSPTASLAPVPLVNYSNGILTINAHDETLRDVLDAVRSQTGASVNLPQSGAGDHVFGTFGPGPMRETLMALLDGSAFNYVMLASPSDSRVVRQLILTPRPGGTSATDKQVTAQVAQSGPGVYGQGFEPDQAEPSEFPQVPVQSAQPTIPPVEANKLLREAQELQQANPNMTRGQVLSEMQKRHSQQLDDAAQSQPAAQQ